MIEKEVGEYFCKRYNLSQARSQQPSKTLMPHQIEARKELEKWFAVRKFPRGGLLVLPTAGGKTFTAIDFLCSQPLSMGYKVLWLAHTHHLLEQAYVSFDDAAGNVCEPKDTLCVRVVSGTFGHYKPRDIQVDDDVIIATLQTMTHACANRHERFLQFLDAAGDQLVVVFDEAHHAPAPSYRKLIQALRRRCASLYLLGLTATPTHSDERKGGWFKELFPQEIIYYITPQVLIARGILAEPVFEDAQTQFTPGFDERAYSKWRYTHQDLPENIINELAESQKRNEFIGETYVANKLRYGKTIIFADRWVQCDYIREYLRRRGVKADVIYSHIDADPNSAEARNKRDKDENARVLQQFRDNEIEVLVNVRMLTEGTDVPDLSTVFLTRQTTSQVLITQMVGRALRGPAVGGTDTAYIVSFIDDWKKMIDWGVPRLLEGGMEGEEALYKYRPLDLISIELVRRLSREMYAGGAIIHPFLTFVPVGWYVTEFFAVTDDEDAPQVRQFVLVYEDAAEGYARLIRGLTQENLDDFEDEQLQLTERQSRLDAWYERYFRDSQDYIGGDLSLNIFNIARHMAQHDGEAPKFVPWSERANLDFDALAEKMIRENLGPLPKEKALRDEFDRADRDWKVFYYNFGQFKTQYNLSEGRLLADEMGAVGSSVPIIHAQERRGHQDDPEFLESEKKEVIERDGRRCLCCGNTNRLQVDHVVSFYNGGKTIPDNAQTLCSVCNRIKGTQEIDFRRNESKLIRPLSDPPSLSSVGLPARGMTDDIERWAELLRRSINLFYRCSAVASVKIGRRGTPFYNWKIELFNGNDPRWLQPHLSSIKQEVNDARRRAGAKDLKSIKIGASGVFVTS